MTASTDGVTIGEPRGGASPSDGFPEAVLVEHRLALQTSRRETPTGNLARVMAMQVSEQLPLADVKNRLSEVVDRVEREHDRVVITRHGKPAAVVLSIDDLESLEETLSILSDPSLMADLHEARNEEPTVLSKADALALIRQR